jgi:hypothetical protein
MGLDQVRDLRHATIETLIQERKQAPFENLRDLMARVPFQGKEIAHLAQCGGLEGLGTSRSAMRAEADRIKSAGSEHQMAFDFDEPEVPAESPAQALKWEKEVLGQPVSVHPLDVVEVPSGTMPLRELDDEEHQNFTVVGVRLPGWTGGGGFYLADRETYVMVQLPDNLRMPKTWSPITLQGSWVGDGMDSYWFQASRISPIATGL